MKKFFLNPWFGFFVILAFAGVISLFHINSAVADAHKLNGLFTIGGIACLIGAAYFLYKANKTSTGKGG
jgi:hypothetical protein